METSNTIFTFIKENLYTSKFGLDIQGDWIYVFNNICSLFLNNCYMYLKINVWRCSFVFGHSCFVWLCVKELIHTPISALEDVFSRKGWNDITLFCIIKCLSCLSPIIIEIYNWAGKFNHTYIVIIFSSVNGILLKIPLFRKYFIWSTLYFERRCRCYTKYIFYKHCADKYDKWLLIFLYNTY